METRTVSAVTLLETVRRGMDAPARMLARDAEASARYGMTPTPGLLVAFTAARVEYESLLRREWDALAEVVAASTR